MATIYFEDGRKQNVTPEVGVGIWQVLNAETEPTEEQERFCSNVSHIFLNWRSELTPDSYIKQNFDALARQIVGHWMIACIPNARPPRGNNDSAGTSVVERPLRLTGPEPGDKDAVKFCEKWGLTKKGWPTQLSKKYWN